MGLHMLFILYFLVIVIVVLALVIVRDKQFLQNMWSKKEVQQEEITDLKLERVRLKHIIKMQDETISHMLTTNVQQFKQLEQPKNQAQHELVGNEWHLDDYESLNREYFQ
ncbi:hypothetical protein [Enterococcus sp. 5H]|uniref:hypothetical protein n=1 Tax=Enterococcus sp. 5H TaxID=1229490 RepID=UPI0023028B4F|nr:hypothetical protein [Enterococcus sp. 5H]MDA9471752.1 hypothetical protein [Enterococcus sp. 5H]